MNESIDLDLEIGSITRLLTKDIKYSGNAFVCLFVCVVWFTSCNRPLFKDNRCEGG